MSQAPRAVERQANRIVRVGVLAPSFTPFNATSYQQDFVSELRQLGFSEGQNLSVDLRWASQDARGPFPVAAELIRSKVDLIVVDGPEIVLGAKLRLSHPLIWPLVGMTKRTSGCFQMDEDDYARALMAFGWLAIVGGHAHVARDVARSCRWWLRQHAVGTDCGVERSDSGAAMKTSRHCRAERKGGAHDAAEKWR